MTNSVWGSFGANFPSREVFATETIITLKALTPPKSSANVTISVDGGNSKGDGSQGIFYYSPSSVVADDGINIIAPTSVGIGAGRWIRSNLSLSSSQFRKNAIINGGMEIAQRGTNFPAAVAGTFPVDRWNYQKSGTMVHTISQDADVPTVIQAEQLFLNSLRANLTTPQAVIGALEFCIIQQAIEGYNWRALAQRACMLSFWVKATLPGIYCVNLRSSASDACFVAEYTILNANTWEKKTIPILASPSAGAWNYTNGIGVICAFTITAGIARQQVPGAWGVINNAYSSANQVNGVVAGATDFRVTGVQLEVGNIATEFERRTIQDEISLCKRYYQKSFRPGTAPAQNIGVGTGEARCIAGVIGVGTGRFISLEEFPVLMRGIPVINTYNPQALNSSVRNNATGVDLFTLPGNITEKGFSIDFSTDAGAATNHMCIVHWTADAEF